MDYCCFCKKKLGAFSPAYRIGEFKGFKGSKEIMCEDCYNRYLTLVKKKLTAYSTPASKSFFTTIASSAEHPDSVRKIAATWLEESASSEHEGYNLPLTTGFYYDGYTITNYLGVVSGDSFIGTGLISDAAAVLSDAFGTESDKLRGKMEEARYYATNRMLKGAYELGANAIIGVHYEYFSMASNMVAVSISGTAVIRKAKEER